MLMPGENCCMNGCGVSRRKAANNPDGKIGLFKILAAKDEKSKQWRKELLNIITKYRKQDKSFKRQLANDTLHICKKHFVPEDITTHHGAKLTKKFLKFGVLPTKELTKKSMDHHFPDQSQKSRPPRSIVKDSDPTDREKSCYKDFKDVCSRVKKLSIKDWHVDVSEDKIEIKKHQVPYILPRLCVEINERLCFTIYVFNWRIPVDHFLYKQFKRTLKLITISELLRIIENLNICKGHSALSHSGKSIQHSIPLFLEEDNEDNPSYAAKHFYRAKYYYRPTERFVTTGQHLQGVAGVQNIADDIMVFGSTRQEHDQAIENRLKRLKEKGLSLNKSKCRFLNTELEFFGKIFSEQGTRPDNCRTQDVIDASIPQNVSELRSFLCELQKTGVTFLWEHKHRTAFNKLKAADHHQSWHILML
eukprot:gene9853-18438_t